MEATVGASSGVVTGVAAGSPIITYTLPTGCFTTTAFVVNPNPAAITGTMTVCVGLTTTLANATPSGTWSSSNTSQATVVAGTGVVTGVADRYAYNYLYITNRLYRGYYSNSEF